MYLKYAIAKNKKIKIYEEVKNSGTHTFYLMYKNWRGTWKHCYDDNGHKISEYSLYNIQREFNKVKEENEKKIKRRNEELEDNRIIERNFLDIEIN